MAILLKFKKKLTFWILCNAVGCSGEGRIFHGLVKGGGDWANCALPSSKLKDRQDCFRNLLLASTATADFGLVSFGDSRISKNITENFSKVVFRFKQDFTLLKMTE